MICKWIISIDIQYHKINANPNTNNILPLIHWKICYQQRSDGKEVGKLEPLCKSHRLVNDAIVNIPVQMPQKLKMQLTDNLTVSFPSMWTRISLKYPYIYIHSSQEFQPNENIHPWMNGSTNVAQSHPDLEI